MSRKIKSKKKILRNRKTAKKAVCSGKNKLSKKELAEFRKLVLRRKDEILADIKHISDDTLKQSQKEASGDISGYTYHMADVATDNYDREFSLGLASNERKFIYELDDALKKIEEGTFGICEDCKGLIAKNRIKAVLHARFCVKCQEKREKR
ncbi:MAG: TraR/DksA family transcriptional regulator [Candidatus Omnitrophota bacterium]